MLPWIELAHFSELSDRYLSVGQKAEVPERRKVFCFTTKCLSGKKLNPMNHL
jgi:hypothetical protein